MKLIENPELKDKEKVFENREQAGLLLVEKLKKYSGKDVIILAIPAGGVPVSKVIAEKLKVKFDLMIVRKIQFPDNPEAGFGAMSYDGEIVLNKTLIKQSFLTKEIIDEQIKKTKKEIERRVKLFRGKNKSPKFKGKIVILVDDGLASGYTMFVAIKTVKKHEPKRLIVAAPTGNSGAIDLIKREADEVYCLNVRDEIIFAVADAYLEWYDLSDSEVLKLLRK